MRMSSVPLDELSESMGIELFSLRCSLAFFSFALLFLPVGLVK